MVLFYDKLRVTPEQQELPIVAKLKGVFEVLDDAELLKALTGKVHRGCQGYQVAALWRSYLTGYVLGIPTVAGLIRRLESDPALCQVCGVTAVPSEATYSRFIAKLTKHRELVKTVMDKGVDQLRQHLPDFGRIVAVDSTDIPAWSQSRKPSDHDARWGKKKDKHGHEKWWFGYKAHVVCDAESELPIHVETTPANASDSARFVPLLGAANVSPTHVLADAGYDAAENYRFVSDALGAAPIIKLNRRGKRAIGIPHRSKNALWIQMYRDHPGVERHSPEWEALYDKRTSVERLFSRAKEFRRLASVHHRGLPKVTLHCFLSTLTIVASAVSAIYSVQPVRKVA